MNLEQAIKLLRARMLCTSGDEAEALAIAIDQLVKADQTRQEEIKKAVNLISDAIFDSNGDLNEGTWNYLKGRIDFPPEEKSEIIRRLGLAEED